MSAGGNRGVTLVELVVSIAIGTVVLGGIIGMMAGLRRMTQAGDLAGALQDGALALAQIERDFRCAVVRADRPGAAVDVSARGVDLVRGEASPDGSVRGQAVHYESVAAGAGTVRLSRRAGSDETLLPGVYRLVRVEPLAGPGGPYVRVTLHMTAHEAPPTGAGSEEAVLTSLVRLPGSELRGSGFTSWTFCDGIPAGRGP